MDRFGNIQNFIHVVETGSITAASERSDLAKSAVSRRLTELETHLGVALFHRTTRKMHLTDTGQVFYQHALRIMGDLEDAEGIASQSHGELRGQLSIALPLSFGLLHIGSALNDFLKLHPNIELNIDFNDREVDLIQEGFDIAIRIADLSNSTLVARRLATIQHVVVASPKYLEHYGVPQKPEDLLHHQCLSYSLMRDYKTWVFTDTDQKEKKVVINPYMKASAGEFLREAAVHDQGVALLPSFIVHKEVEQGQLSLVMREYKAREVNAYAIYPSTRHLSQRVRILADFLIQRFEGVPYWDICLQDCKQKPL